MNKLHSKLLSVVAVSCIALPLRADTTSNAPTQNFTNVVQYELGDSQFAPGDSIKLEALSGTSGAIEPGGTYCVTGTYVLNSRAEADLSFFATTTNRTASPVEPQQTIQVTKGTGSFRLVKKMNEPGYLHLTFYSRSNGQGFGGVYFGQGQWVLHGKPFSYSNAESPSKEPASPLSISGPNQVLFEYLGNPVAPPPNMVPAYSKGGLTRAMQDAAQKAGISLIKIEIDDSEFPFLVGVVLARSGDRQKLEEQIRKVEAFNFSGGVSGNTISVMNIVPSRVFPSGSSQRIHRRMMLREAVLYEKITGQR